MNDRPFASATERNSQPILGVLRQEFGDRRSILEIGSGTGQHAVCFAAALEHLDWQTSDLEENHAAIHAWLDDADLPNVRKPLVLDVRTAEVPDAGYDGVFSANTAHIMSFPAVEKMFALVGTALAETGVFCLYGPFRQGGEFNTVSNRDFDRSLRERDPEMGIRDLEALDELAGQDGLHRVRLYAMPTNNHMAVWMKGGRSQ